MVQWYEKDPQLLESEKDIMKRTHPDFKLGKLEDGRLYWLGEIKSLFNTGHKYALMVLYHPNHPFWQMGSSVNVYMVLPELLDLNMHYYLRPQDTPFNLCAQTCIDSNDEAYQSVWIHGEVCPMSAARQLSLYLSWLFVSECQTECNMRYIDWCSLTNIYPSLETIIRNLLYATI